MPNGGAVRGKWDSDAPHNHTQAGVPGTFRSWDDSATTHIVGSGTHPPHGCVPPCGGALSLQHVHSKVTQETFLINSKPLVLETDTGCWDCCCCGGIFEYIVDDSGFGFFVEDKSVAVQGKQMMDSGSLHSGNASFTNGGSGDFFIGTFKTSAEPHG